MSLLSKESFREAQPSELSLFELPPTQTAVERVVFEEHRPISTLSGMSLIKFHISGQNSMDYIDLKRSRLHVKAKIKTASNENMAASEKTGPVNLFFHATFGQIDVFLSGKLVPSNTNNYPYKAMFLTLLNYGEDAKSSQLLSQLFIEDEGGVMDDSDPAGGNTGLYERAKYTSESKTVDMSGPILHDLFCQDRFLLNQVDIQVRLYRTKPSFCIMSKETTPDYHVEIQDIVLEACKLKLNPAVIYGHAEILKTVTAKYPYTKTEVKMMSIPTGNVSFVWDNMFQGNAPSRVIIAFARSNAISGDYKKNPFNFLNLDITQLHLTCDGVTVQGSGPEKLNFSSSNGEIMVTPFINMFQTADMWGNNDGNNLTRKDFISGYTLFCFDLQPVFGQRSSFLKLLKKGNVRLEVQFGTALSETVSCIVYSETPA
ncbi:hypothetical protein KUTeg_010502 [Tegillarca granosa]|uniref:Uncharacterized protein n=1 Tax=Tegillarca granosa TaxID=220873 RepID=A0ABQ9F3H2_TEGGR|nr:hypothetical protein KUTeg_010502 [Tegillarca granosa]